MLNLGRAPRKKKSKEASASTTLASVTKEMAQPRFAESARKEEEANRHVATKEFTGHVKA